MITSAIGIGFSCVRNNNNIAASGFNSVKFRIMPTKRPAMLNRTDGFKILSDPQHDKM